MLSSESFQLGKRDTPQGILRVMSDFIARHDWAEIASIAEHQGLWFRRKKQAPAINNPLQKEQTQGRTEIQLKWPN